MSLLLKYWQVILGGGLVAVAAVFLHNWDVSRLEGQYRADLVIQNNKVVEECQAKQKQVQEISNGYEKNLTTVNSKLADAIARLRAKPSTGQVSTASGYNAATSGDRLYWKTKQSARTALELGAQADRQTQQLISCQAYIKALD